jgi:prepilin-type N-terminal cleavage/methylation domain-containing protein
MGKRQLIKGQTGFTLIEIMIAMSVSVIAILGFITAVTSIRQSSEGAYERTIAMQDANRVIEQMRDTSTSGTFPDNVTAAYPNNTAVSGFSSLTSEQVTVSYASTTADPLDVTVTVTWLAHGRRSMSKAIRTFITQRA